MSPVAIVDLDGTVVPFVTAFAAIAMELYGIQVPTEPAEFLGVFEGLTEQQIARCLKRCNLPSRMPEPYPDAVRVINRLAEAGWDVRFYTDRPKTAYEPTKKWLIKHGFPAVDSLRCCEGSKHHSIRKVKDVQVIFEDNPKVIEWAINAGIPHVVGLSQSYNRHLSNSVASLVESWEHLEEVVFERI